MLDQGVGGVELGQVLAEPRNQHPAFRSALAHENARLDQAAGLAEQLQE
jgi:hypothetical protein